MTNKNLTCIVMQDLIDSTNKFYLEMSRKVLSEKECDVLKKLIVYKMTLNNIAEQYCVTADYIKELYEQTYSKTKIVTELLDKIDHYDKKLQALKRELNPNPSPAQIRKEKAEKDRQKLLYNSHFPFSKRMYSMFEALDIQTVRELAEIPLEKFSCFRGFKKQSKTELIAFIEFENIEHLFEGFYEWKKEPLE